MTLETAAQTSLGFTTERRMRQESSFSHNGAAPKISKLNNGIEADES
jgi:hypothetical protein